MVDLYRKEAVEAAGRSPIAQALTCAFESLDAGYKLRSGEALELIASPLILLMSAAPIDPHASLAVDQPCSVAWDLG